MACFHGLREELSRVIRTCATFYVLDSNLFKSVSTELDLESSTLEMQHLIKLYSGNNNLILRSHQFQDKEYLEMQEDAIEDELLVKVPGSAYTSGNDMVAGSEALEESSNSKKIPMVDGKAKDKDPI